MVLTGYTHRFALPLPCRAIIAAEYADSGDPALLAGHCLETVDVAFADVVREGDIVVASGLVGDGPGDEAAVLALQAAGVAALVCGGANPDFVAMAESYGLPVLTCAAAAAAVQSGALLRIDLASGGIEERGQGRSWRFAPPADTVLDTTRRTQLLFRMRRMVDEEGIE